MKYLKIGIITVVVIVGGLFAYDIFHAYVLKDDGIDPCDRFIHHPDWMVKSLRFNRVKS